MKRTRTNEPRPTVPVEEVERPPMKRTRTNKPRPTVPVKEIEKIRLQLDLRREDFSKLLGLSPSSWSSVLKGEHTYLTTYMAAERLRDVMQGQGSTNSKTEIFIIRVTDGVPSCFRVSELRRGVIDDDPVYFVPAEEKPEST